MDLGARTWYRPALWPLQSSGSTKTPSSRSSAITGSPSSSTNRATRIATCRPSSTTCSAVVPWRRAIRRICARIAWQRNAWRSVARAASASPAAKVYVDEWVAHSGRTLSEGVAYRPVGLTMPDALHRELYRDRPLLADLMPCGVALLSDALSWCTQVTLEAGYVVVLETAGRSGHWHPHLHILMTSGGMTPQQQWREVDYFPFTVLHKKWQYHLFTMVKHRVGTRAIKDKIDAL